MVTHVQAHFCQISLGTQIAVEVCISTCNFCTRAILTHFFNKHILSKSLAVFIVSNQEGIVIKIIFSYSCVSSVFIFKIKSKKKNFFNRLLAVTLIMLIKLGKLNLTLDLLTLQSKILPQLTLQELI